MQAVGVDYHTITFQVDGTSTRYADLHRLHCISLTLHAGKEVPLEDLFRYSHGRFLVNEDYELAKRYSPFDISALCQRVSSILDSPIVKIDKREGGYNKALLMTAENGHSVIAKIPCPNIVPRGYGTASEGAVLKFGMDCCNAHHAFSLM